MIIERDQRRESSVEEALIEMFLAGASVRRAGCVAARAGVPAWGCAHQIRC
jgi:hypothetical protein